MAFGSDMYAAHRRSTGDLTLAVAVGAEESEGMGASERALQRGSSSPAISLCDIDGCPGCRGMRSQMGLPHHAPVLPSLASSRSKSEGRIRNGDDGQPHAAYGRDSADRRSLPGQTEEAEVEAGEGVFEGVPVDGREGGAGRLMPLEELSVRGTSSSARLARGQGQQQKRAQQQQQVRGDSQGSGQSVDGQGREQSLHGLPLELSESIFQRLLHDMQEAAAEGGHEAFHTHPRAEPSHDVGLSSRRHEAREAHHRRASGAGSARPASLQAVYGDQRWEGRGIPQSISLHGLPEELSESIHCQVLTDLRRQEQGRHGSRQHVSLQDSDDVTKAVSVLDAEGNGTWGIAERKGRGQGGGEGGKDGDGAHGVDTRCSGHKKGRLERFASFCKMSWRSHHEGSRMNFAH